MMSEDPLATDSRYPREDPLSRIYKLAQQAAMSVYRPADIEHREAFDVAVEAILECFAEGTEDRVAILRRCNIRIQHAARQARKFAGRVAHEPGRTHPGYVCYAHIHSGFEAPFEDPLLERIAVMQVYFALGERDQEVLWLEACGEREDRPGWAQVVKNSRDRARELWFDHEQPPRHYRYRRTAA
jgi:hypothetical protein